MVASLSVLSSICPLWMDYGQCPGLHYGQVICIGKVPIPNEFDNWMGSVHYFYWLRPHCSFWPLPSCYLLPSPSPCKVDDSTQCHVSHSEYHPSKLLWSNGLVQPHSEAPQNDDWPSLASSSHTYNRGCRICMMNWGPGRECSPGRLCACYSWCLSMKACMLR